MRTVVDTVPTLALVLGIVLVSVWAVRRFVPGTRDGFAAEVFTAMQEFKPATTAQISFYDYSVSHLNAVREARSNRLDSSDGNDLPVLIAALIAVGAVVILGYATVVGSTSSAFHAIGAGAIAVVVGFALVVLVALQFPFSGGLAVDSKPFGEGALTPLPAGAK